MPGQDIIQWYHTSLQHWLISTVLLDAYILGTAPSRWYNLLVKSHLDVFVASILSPESFFNSFIPLLAEYYQREHGKVWKNDSGHLQATCKTHQESAPWNHSSQWTELYFHTETSGMMLCELCLKFSWLKLWCKHLHTLVNLVGNIGDMSLTCCKMSVLVGVFQKIVSYFNINL